MKNSFKYFGISWIVGFLLFNAVTFLIPSEVFGVTRFDKSVFWIAYVFIIISFVIQLITAYKFIKGSKEKMFLNIPLLRIGHCAVIVSTIIGIAFMVFPILPAWIGAIVCLLITGYFVIASINASIVANVVEKVDMEVKTKTRFIRMAIVEAEEILSRAKTNEVKAEVKKVYEALKYSDPMSKPEFESIEQAIDNELRALKQAVMANDKNSTLSISASLLLNINDRNKNCKALK